MRKKAMPTFIGLFILIFGLAAGLVLIQGRQIFRLGAFSDFKPGDVRISNIADHSFTVSWVTAKEAIAFIKWGKSAGNLDKTAEEANKSPSFIHSISVSGLSPSTHYFFKIDAAGNNFDNNGSPWQIKTGPALFAPEKTNLVSGSVLKATGKPAKGALVYLTAGGGALLSTVTSQNGNWLIPLSSFVEINESQTLLEIAVNAGPDGVASAQVYPQSARPAPPIILGQVNDFKNAPVSETSGLPEAVVQVPKESEPESGFNVEGAPAGTTPKTVTLESVDQGEVVTSTKPEFFGEAPAGTSLEITLQSETITGQVTVDKNEKWKWSPPSDLSEGTHKIKISWRDTGGILRTIERTFIVQAAEGPAFESTPSGTPKASPTASPSATPKATPTASATPAATLIPEVSDSGVLTPTIALFIMGVGILIFSFLTWRKAEN